MYLIDLIILLILTLSCSGLRKTSRKLDFFFKRDDFYCPLNHKKTSIVDLCYLVSHKKKNSYQEADEHCQKNSHRLVQIENHEVWLNIKQGLDKMFEPSMMTYLNLSFYIEAENASLVENYKSNNFFCNLNKNSTLKNTCLELKYSFLNQSSFICLNLVSCKKHRYAFCEWRGENIQSYNLNLKNQILNAFLSVMFAFSLFFASWVLIYCNHKRLTRDELNHLFETHLKEKQIFE